MARPTTAISETSPAGNDQINAGDNRIREYKVQNREILEEDHVYPSSGTSATAGFHKKMALVEIADLGTGATGLPILGAQTVSGKPELLYTDEDDNDVQITSAGKIHAPNLAGVYPAANVAALATMMNLIYPVGSYYFNDSVSTNPATLLGIGTWVAVEERVLVGFKTGSAEFGTAGGEYGTKTTTLTAAQSGLPAHTHPISAGPGDQGGAYNTNSDTAPNRTLATDANSAADASEAHTNLQPSRTVYMWRRTV